MIQSLTTRVKNYAKAGVLATAGLGASTYYAVDHYSYAPAKEAMTRPVGTAVRAEMKVGEARYFGPRVGTLISNVPFREDPEGKSRVTIHVPGQDLKSSVGKTIRVVGKVAEYQGKKQLEAESVEVR